MDNIATSLSVLSLPLLIVLAVATRDMMLLGQVLFFILFLWILSPTLSENMNKYVGLLYCVFFSYQSYGFGMVAIGHIFNILAISLNHGLMPVHIADEDAELRTRILNGNTHSILDASTRVVCMCDIFWGTSIGDILIVVGLLVFTVGSLLSMF